MDARFDAGMTFYRSYICGRTTFSQDLAARHGRELAFDFEPDVLTEMYRAYLRRYHVANLISEAADRGKSEGRARPRRARPPGARDARGWP